MFAYFKFSKDNYIFSRKFKQYKHETGSSTISNDKCMHSFHETEKTLFPPLDSPRPHKFIVQK